MAQESPLLEMGRKVYNTFEKLGAYKSSDKPTAHSKAIDEMNKSQRAKDVAAATASFAKKGVGAKTPVAKSKAKRGQRKAAKKVRGK